MIIPGIYIHHQKETPEEEWVSNKQVILIDQTKVHIDHTYSTIPKDNFERP